MSESTFDVEKAKEQFGIDFVRYIKNRFNADAIKNDDDEYVFPWENTFIMCDVHIYLNEKGILTDFNSIMYSIDNLKEVIGYIKYDLSTLSFEVVSSYFGGETHDEMYKQGGVIDSYDRKKFSKVMREFYQNKLYSNDVLVEDKSQALAIAYSESSRD